MLSNAAAAPEAVTETVVSLHHVSRYLADHHARRVSVPGNVLRHHGGVRHPQVWHTVHPQLRVDHRLRVTRRAHPAGAHVVVKVVSDVAGRAFPVCVTERVQVAALRIGNVEHLQN